MAAHRSEHAVRREATEVASRADAEFVNKRQCIEAERKAQHQQTLATNLTSPPATKSTIHSQSAIKPGQYVLVLQDLSPGKCSYGGEAWVQAVRGTGGSIVCDIEYMKNATGNKTRSETALPLSRLTVKNCAWHEAQLCHDSDKRGSKRKQQVTTPPPEKLQSKDLTPLKDVLSLACQSGKSKGWRAREIMMGLGIHTTTSKRSLSFIIAFVATWQN